MSFGLIRANYLLIFAIIGAYMPYLPIYLHRLGLDSSQIGWVMGVYGAVMIFTPIIVTHLADRHLSNRRLLVGCTLAAGVTMGGLACLEGGFIPVMTLFILFSIASAPLGSLLDGLTFSLIHHQQDSGHKPPHYHRLRMWGSLGYTLPGLGLMLYLRFTHASERAAIALSAVIGLLASLMCLLLPQVRRPDQPPGAAPPTVRAWRIICRPPVRSVVGPMILLAAAMSVFYTFFTRYLQELKVDSQWIGMVVNIGVFVEVLCILGSRRIIDRLGVRGVMLAGTAATVVRFCILCTTDSLWLVIGQQVLHGPMVLAMLLLGPMYVNHKADHGFRNSIQGLYALLCFGLARVVGSVVGGYVAQWGPGDAAAHLVRAFELSAMVSLAALVWLAAAFYDPEAERYFRRPRRREPEIALPVAEN